MQNIENSLKNILTEINSIENTDGIPRIIAVSKKQSLTKIKELYALGINEFGESFVQEAIEKINQLEINATWHFIGNIQSNKTKLIAKHFDWVHSVSRYKTAERLNKQRINLKPINVCVLVKIDQYDERESIDPNEVRDLLSSLKKLKNLRLRGLMGISLPTTPIEDRKNGFSKLYKLYSDLNSEGYKLDTLSMGMSEDYKIAIKNGSNMIRIGTVLFGERQK